MSKQEKMELSSVNVDLVPVKNWRTLAKSGRRAMNYKIFAHAKTAEGKLIGVAANMFALDANGDIADFGSEECPAIAQLLAKSDSNLDTAKIKYMNDGKIVTDAEGRPVYDEVVMQDDGVEFPLEFGTLFFCPLKGGIKITALGVELVPAIASNGQQRMAKDASGNPTIPVFDMQMEKLSVERRASATGPKLFGKVKIGATDGGAANVAARRTAAAAAESVGDVESVGM